MALTALVGTTMLGVTILTACDGGVMRQIQAWCLTLALGLPALDASATETPVDPALREMLKSAAAETTGFKDNFDAWVWLADMSRRLEKKIPDAVSRISLLKSVHHEAGRARLRPELVLAVIEAESNFDRFAISRVGARGLMQIMPFWLSEIGRPDDNLFDVDTNLRYGCTILRYYM
ncbi:MAG: transglycosylase SLT domain-containing protein, partial [Acidiferrobacterales bacterium]|nr:transglycosylase SLT domain-containing protein [Acidiferrobacterales bacterium]